MYRESSSLHGPVYSIFNGRIAAIDPASGRVRWTLVTDATVQKPTMVADAAALYVFVEGTLLAAAAEDGQIRWRTPVPVETGIRLELHAGLVLLQTQGRLRAYGVTDGVLRWEIPSSNVVVASPGS